MKILLVNVDCKWNLAIRRMYAYFSKDNEVEMIDLNLPGYPHNYTTKIDGRGYDRAYVSIVFEENKDKVVITDCDFVEYGGIGSNYPDRKLPPEIESTPPFYYDYEDTSQGFITRGCIRNCWFCKVHQYEGSLRPYNTVQDVIGDKKRALFLDNNILAYDKHKEVFKYLVNNRIWCNFKQGLDFRLVDDENLELLSEMRYIGEYIFAFDDPSYRKALDEKIILIKKWIPRPWKVKFYIYHHPSMSLLDLVSRVEWCKSHECLPYVMRDLACWDSDDEERNFVTSYAAYCNQPRLFLKMSFEQFMRKSHNSQKRIDSCIAMYNKLLGELCQTK